MIKIISLLFFSPLLLFSQNIKQDLYIAYKDCSLHTITKINNDTLTYENYQIRFGDKVKPEIEFSVSESGDLLKKIKISGKSYPSLSLTYSNPNNENPPIIITENQIKNKIWAQNIIYSKNTDFTTFFRNFKNIYLVDYNKNSEIKTAKKIEITLLKSL